jgi:hypothetical protein
MQPTSTALFFTSYDLNQPGLDIAGLVAQEAFWAKAAETFLNICVWHMDDPSIRKHPYRRRGVPVEGYSDIYWKYDVIWEQWTSKFGLPQFLLTADRVEKVWEWSKRISMSEVSDCMAVSKERQRSIRVPKPGCSTRVVECASAIDLKLLWRNPGLAGVTMRMMVYPDVGEQYHMSISKNIPNMMLRACLPLGGERISRALALHGYALSTTGNHIFSTNPIGSETGSMARILKAANVGLQEFEPSDTGTKDLRLKHPCWGMLGSGEKYTVVDDSDGKLLRMWRQASATTGGHRRKRRARPLKPTCAPWTRASQLALTRALLRPWASTRAWKRRTWSLGASRRSRASRR